MAFQFEIPTRVHNNTGFWGPVDAIHQFCEPHYNTSHYFAEFWNATTSIIFPVVACHAYLQIRHLPNMGWMKLACAWLSLIGVGSFLYHATMRRSMQLLDEAPMIFFMATCVMSKLQYHAMTKDHVFLFRTIVALGSLMLVYVYAVLELYGLFIQGFCFLIALEVIAGYGWMYVGETKLAVATGTLITIGRLVWETEQHMCDIHPFVWFLHMIWHASSALSAYNWMLFNAFLVDRLENKRERMSKLKLKST